MQKMLVASSNPGKLKEYRLLLESLSITLISLTEAGISDIVEENGTTFAENARLKAATYARKSGMLALADDSGLEVDALDGAPGVFSARYGDTRPGEDAKRCSLLLARMAERAPLPQQRTARFRCVVAVATPRGEIFSADGHVEGMIAAEPAGDGGFGYDPIFYLPEQGCTMAQLPAEQKNLLSHRARALRAALPILQNILKLSQAPEGFLPGEMNQETTAPNSPSLT